MNKIVVGHNFLHKHHEIEKLLPEKEKDFHSIVDTSDLIHTIMFFNKYPNIREKLQTYIDGIEDVENRIRFRKEIEALSK